MALYQTLTKTVDTHQRTPQTVLPNLVLLMLVTIHLRSISSANLSLAILNDITYINISLAEMVSLLWKHKKECSLFV